MKKKMKSNRDLAKTSFLSAQKISGGSERIISIDFENLTDSINIFISNKLDKVFSSKKKDINRLMGKLLDEVDNYMLSLTVGNMIYDYGLETCGDCGAIFVHILKNKEDDELYSLQFLGDNCEESDEENNEETKIPE
jgi:hypothetical protein